MNNLFFNNILNKYISFYYIIYLFFFIQIPPILFNILGIGDWGLGNYLTCF